MDKLNENEKRILKAIADDCDDLDGDLFTRMPDIVAILKREFGFSEQVAGGYISDLIKKGYLDEDEDDDLYGMGVWVNLDAD